MSKEHDGVTNVKTEKQRFSPTSLCNGTSAQNSNLNGNQHRLSDPRSAGCCGVSSVPNNFSGAAVKPSVWVHVLLSLFDAVHFAQQT